MTPFLSLHLVQQIGAAAVVLCLTVFAVRLMFRWALKASAGSWSGTVDEWDEWPEVEVEGPGYIGRHRREASR